MAATTATSLMHLIMENSEKWMMEFYCGETSDAHGFGSFQENDSRGRECGISLTSVFQISFFASNLRNLI